MSAFPSYSTGTVAIAANATSVVGTGSNWTGQNAMSGDTFSVPGVGQIKINDTTDATHLAIDAWPFAAVTAGTAYSIKKDSPNRFVGAQTMVQVDQMVTALDTNGFYVFVGPDATVPDPSLGQDEQYALQATTGKLWQKTGGTWNFIGIQKGFSLTVPWDSATAYNAFDTVSLNGTSYVCILANTNQTPPNATFWTVLAAAGAKWFANVTGPPGGQLQPGDFAINTTNGEVWENIAGTYTIVANLTGPQGIKGASYACTSATSFAIGTGSKAFTTQAGLAWLPGARARVSSLAGGGANYMEGVVTAYSGTTLTVNVSKVVGSGTDTDWQISLAGDPGSGDLLSTNNLSDVGSATTARGNLGLVAIASSGSASDLSAGTVPTARLGSGTANTTTFVRGDQSWAPPSGPMVVRAWVSHNGSGTIADSFKVTSVSHTGVGLFTINLSITMANAVYPMVGSNDTVASNTFFEQNGKTTTTASVRWMQGIVNSPQDPGACCVIIFGS